MARDFLMRSTMEAGQRDRVITIQQWSESIGASGAPVETWTTLVSSMPAAKRVSMGRERFTANQEVSSADTTFEINYRLDMDPDLVDVPKTRRLVYDGRVYDIVSAEEIGRKVGIRLMTLSNTGVSA
jgi:SPP1 family predicted phage head-tail adaptor